MEIKGVRIKKINRYKHGEGIYELRPPEFFSVPLVADDGEQPQRAVNVGEGVKEGSLIAKPSGRYGTYVYSPCSGKVVGVVKKLNASGIECEHVLIVRDLGDEKETLEPLDSFHQDQEHLLKRLYESGMVDNFPPYDPAYKKYLLKNKIKTLLINVTEDDPYLSSDSALLETYTKEVVEGARLLQKVANAEKLEFVFSTNNSVAKSALSTYLKQKKDKTIKIKTYPSVYPLRNARLMAYYETGVMLPKGARTAQMSIIVDCVANCYDFFKAVTNGEVVTKKVVTIAGNNTLRKGNYFISNGTSIKHILSVVGYKDKFVDNMLVYGGIMSGIAQERLDISAGLTASVILFCNEEEYSSEHESPCINCGRCLDCCPVKLNVKRLDDAIVERKYSYAKKLGVTACIECGACSYVCPARRYLAQRMGFAKDLAEGKRGKRPSSSDYVLIEGEDLDRDDELETSEEKINTTNEQLPAVDEMLSILAKKTEEEASVDAKNNASKDNKDTGGNK